MPVAQDLILIISISVLNMWKIIGFNYCIWPWASGFKLGGELVVFPV